MPFLDYWIFPAIPVTTKSHYKPIISLILLKGGGGVMVIIVRKLDLQLTIQSVPITSKVVSSNPVHGEMYSIQHYMIKFDSDLRQIGDFLRVLRFPTPVNLTDTI